MNTVETNLSLTLAPLSIKEFKRKKDIAEYKTKLDKASLYIIVQREVPEIKVNEEKCDEKEISLTIKLPKFGLELNAIYVLPEIINNVAFKNTVHKNGWDRLTFDASHGLGVLMWQGDIKPFITYNVLYVGQCAKEPLTKRFKAHHALMDMLIEEHAISSKSTSSEELILMPFTADSYVTTTLTGDSSDEDFVRAFTNNYTFTSDMINKDSEKALVRAMNPKYNKIRFKNYPKSEDGLYKTEADVYCYSIAENIILKYTKGFVYGATDVLFSSKIIGDRQGDLNVYAPGEDYVQKYAEQIYPPLTNKTY